MKPEKTVFTLGELFCGAGGLALGAMTASASKGDRSFHIEHGWASDYNDDSCRTYIRNICQDRPYSVFCKDVRSLDIASLPAIDAFAFGFPCNDFSIVGEKKGFDGEFGPLYSYGTKVLNHFKPKFFVAENVGGIISANDGMAFRAILNDLEQSGNGYELTAHLYKSEEYGIPQTRHRMIIVGIEKSLNVTFKIPTPTTRNNPLSVRFVLENPKITGTASNHELTAQSNTVIERLKHINPGENAWNANLPDHLKLNVKGAKLSQIYKRLHPDKPSYTITGSGGGGTHVYHWRENRALTNRERARIQSFPDTFVFEGSKESVRKQIGMAVPPELSRVIFTAILKCFAGMDYPYIASHADTQMQLI